MNSCRSMMMAQIIEIGGERVLQCDSAGPVVDSDRDAMDLIADAMGSSASTIALPVSRLGASFFQLRSGIAGAIAQKAMNYRVKLAFIGDISEHVAASDAFRDWVRETSRGGDIWFAATMEDVAQRLGRRAAS